MFMYIQSEWEILSVGVVLELIFCRYDRCGIAVVDTTEIWSTEVVC